MSAGTDITSDITSDVAVVGAGIIGLSTAHHLARQGFTVTIYESGRPGYGQSAGQSRIFRHAHDDPRLVGLAVQAREQWRMWSEDAGTPLISADGAVALGPAVPRRQQILQQQGVAVETLDSAALCEVLPILRDLDDTGFDGSAMLDVDGGSIDTRAAITWLADRFAEVTVGEQVIALHRTGDGVTIRTPTTAGTHGAVIICAGRGSAALARGVGMSVPVQLGAHVRVSFAVRDRGIGDGGIGGRGVGGGGTPENASRMPTLQDGSGMFGATGVYAAVYPDRSGYGLGMAESVDAHDDGAIDDGAGLADLADAAARYVATALPGLDPTPRDVVHCWVTGLPWGDDGMAIWRTGPIVVFAGHNLFKHAPVIGEKLADTIRTGRVPAVFAPEARLGAAD
ncbi:FAD-binding oxidoreductase [Gordonia sp. OPL2]|uniref:NAD(P)/FAD-dependent oxidoreductase n=1 Tax=Gordonia sp. OPL2 TaxID=2486274 RepID=UPI0016559510|nr:FAD-dependent oxidoreductase [Gordonia sp. OPL2]ROZ88613.1 FAD-binding oxidoreductase [Gordonia sp. OPL2]